MQFTGCIVQHCSAIFAEKGLLDIFIPKTTISQHWQNRKATIDFKTCAKCLNRHRFTIIADVSSNQ
jgi:hypothetical protein